MSPQIVHFVWISIIVLLQLSCLEYTFGFSTVSFTTHLYFSTQSNVTEDIVWHSNSSTTDLNSAIYNGTTEQFKFTPLFTTTHMPQLNGNLSDIHHNITDELEHNFSNISLLSNISSAENATLNETLPVTLVTLPKRYIKRLPPDIVPLHYKIHLRLDPNDLVFEGHCVITISIKQIENITGVNNITLHSRNLNITQALYEANGTGK